jgi:hypothetical protein
MAREGDRLGHLVRGVQMLRSYGDEAKITRYSDVVDWTGQADYPPALCCVLECMSDATLEGLSGIARETQWALGDEEKTLEVFIMQYGNERFQEAPPPLQSLLNEKALAGCHRLVEGHDFAQMCDWGQQMMGEDVPIIGEWPSATGR